MTTKAQCPEESEWTRHMINALDASLDVIQCELSSRAVSKRLIPEHEHERLRRAAAYERLGIEANLAYELAARHKPNECESPSPTIYHLSEDALGSILYAVIITFEDARTTQLFAESYHAAYACGMLLAQEKSQAEQGPTDG